MKRIPLLALFFAVVASRSLAQKTPSPWQGEWGDDSPSAGRLTISSCNGPACTFHLSHGGCGTARDADLVLSTPTEASADLPGQNATFACHLHFNRHPSATSVTIDIKQSGNGCAYYCISGATGFDTTVTQRSHVAFAGSHSEECLQNTGPARRSTCLDASLAALEATWEELYPQFPLLPVPNGANGYQQVTQLDASIVAQCNVAANPAECLRTRLTSDITAMNVKKAAFIAGYTDRGDPAEGGRLARTIAGRYRHTFENGDVQGHTYRSTDTLTISPVGKASISFDADLNFYNGHSCSIGGGALYRRDGSFVFDDDPANTAPDDSVCHLAIVPTAKGVTLKDLTGSCKMAHCGARGSLDGAEFTFRERIAPKPSAPEP